jgi:hypothetical protein
VSALALASDVDVGALVLQLASKTLSRQGTRVDSRITTGSIDRTMVGASTLSFTLEDERRDLLRSGLFSRQIDVELDGQWWRLVKVAKAGDQLTLTFEDRCVAYLRAINTPRKASRSKMTRAEFALSIVREVKQGGGIPFVCPDLHVQQKVAPIVDSSQETTDAQRKAAVGQGLSSSARLTVKGAPATDTQKANAERCLDVANSLSAGPRATLALIEAVIVESAIQNLDYGDADSLGILQVRSSTAASMGINNRDVSACCNAFLTRGFTGAGGAIAVAAKYPERTTGQVAQTVQGSAYPGRYDQAQTEAQAFVDNYTGGTPGGALSTSTITKALPYQFQRGGTDGTKEDSWTCLQRLAQEVNWRCFVVDGSVYFVAETTLLKAKPTLTISEDTLGVDAIDFDVDNGKAKSEATISARSNRWSTPPGSVIELQDCGPADGRWLVEEVSRGIFDPSATITLKRATAPLAEPAPSTTTVTPSSPFGTTPGLGSDVGLTSDGKGDGSTIARAYAAAQAIDAKRYPYVWGGGHAHCGTPDRGTGLDPGIGYDCSGSTCAVLAAAGMGYTLGAPADVSGTIAARWGAAGEGSLLTVWANSIHVFMVFHTPTGDQHFGTGNWGKSWGGPGFNPELHPTAGFTPRHWPGT